MKSKLLALLLVFALVLGVGAPRSEASAATMSATSITLRVGAVYTLRTTGLVGTVKWTSSKSSVASVSGGKVTAKDDGTTTIKAKAGSTTVKCKVIVKPKSGKSGAKYNPKTFPTSGTKNITFNYYLEGREIGKFKISIPKFAYGSESAKMAKNNSSNPKPTSTQQYLYFRVKLTYVSGKETVLMRDVFNYNTNIYGAYGAKYLKPIDWGYGFESYEAMSKFTTISPGTTRTAGAAILVEKGFTPITFRLQTGKNSYTWIKL